MTTQTTTSSRAQAGGVWTDAELLAAVDAYLWMLSEEQSARSYNKSEVRRKLIAGSLSARNDQAIEYRMRNISTAMEDLRLPQIAGYLPARNVGLGVKTRIKKVIADRFAIDISTFDPTADEELLNRRARTLSHKLRDIVPSGIEHPIEIEGTRRRFVRDPLVRAFVLSAAGGHCELCRSPAPFIDDLGEPFLQIHHVRRLADGGSETVTNAVALCPNCHSRCHYSVDRAKASIQLYSRISRLVPE